MAVCTVKLTMPPYFQRKSIINNDSLHSYYAIEEDIKCFKPNEGRWLSKARDYYPHTAGYDQTYTHNSWACNEGYSCFEGILGGWRCITRGAWGTGLGGSKQSIEWLSFIVTATLAVVMWTTIFVICTLEPANIGSPLPHRENIFPYKP